MSEQQETSASGKPIDDITPEASAEFRDEFTDKRPRIEAAWHAYEAQTKIIEALHAANDPPWLFQRGRSLVRVVYINNKGDLLPQIEALTVDTLRPIVGQVARVWKPDRNRKTGKRVTDARREQLAAVLGAPSWPFPVLEGLSEVPFLRPDGSLHTLPGYDPATYLVYVPAPGLVIPSISFTPTAKDVAAARALLVDELIGEFPFKDEADRVNAVALLLLPYLRTMIAGPLPIHLVEAPAAGTGKSLLVEACLRPAIGATLAADAEQREETETTKWVTTKAMRGAAACWIDNIKYPLDNSVLWNATTSPRWTARLLGTNEEASFVFRPVWVITANNPTITEEGIRRIVRIRLDAEMEKPATRETFRHNLHKWIPQQRGALVAAALTLIRAWVVAGQPHSTAHMGSYEDYAHVLGGLLDYIGLPGFLSNADELYAVADPESAQWVELVLLWDERFGSEPVTAKDLYELAQKIPTFDLSGLDRAQQTRFGMALGKQRDKIYAGFKIVRAGEQRRAAKWRLVKLGYQQYAENFSTFTNPAVQPTEPCAVCKDTAWYWVTDMRRWECATCYP